MKWNATTHLLLVLCGFLVALLPRFIPLSFFRNRRIPTWFNEWMKYVPIALFTSLVVKDIVITKNYTFSVSGKLPDLIASAIVLGIAYWTRSMALSVIGGLIAIFALSFFV
ncbi:branched-chain amino acid transporter [Philodulcilactobacillus myokoensis]|uniref:Branched-chain amino acid transporter n=1 Tax=Philodulcilactobacillus myokoensis TaxID=2929573 RepID=A0A9W6B3Q4_9LACO|nr:AzlD domain-containing protein [Philodulcilactobacillus myokoensis]GLB47249.1 branched-chain amino acid transporter [Philodulcilactobacillus myokoensis]